MQDENQYIYCRLAKLLQSVIYLALICCNDFLQWRISYIPDLILFIIFI